MSSHYMMQQLILVLTTCESYLNAWYLSMVLDAYDGIINEFTRRAVVNFKPTFRDYCSTLTIYVVKLTYMVAFMFYVVNYSTIYWDNFKQGREFSEINWDYLPEVENEVGALDDIFTFMVLFFVFIGWFYLFTLFAHFICEKHLTTILFFWVVLVISIFYIPSFVIYQLGIAFGSYVRGAGSGQHVFFEALLDFIAMSVIFIRFFIQNIRFLLIFIAFFELYEYVYLNHQYSSFTIIMSWSDLCAHIKWSHKHLVNFQLTFFDFLVSTALSLMYYFYYLIHLTLLFIAQLSIYFLLSFWLFFFLYTCFMMKASDKSFFYKSYFNISYNSN